MNRCVNCNNIVIDGAENCNRCGYPIYTIATLKTLLGNFVGHLANFQSESACIKDYLAPKFPVTFQLIDEDINLASIVINDLFKWLLYLRTSEERIKKEEVDFINLLFEKPYIRQKIIDGKMQYEEVVFNGFILDLPYTKEKIDNLISTKLDKNYPHELPASFKIFFEYDNSADFKAYKWADGFLYMYEWTGKFYNAIDGNLYGPKSDLFNSYMDNLKKNLNNFKLRYKK